MTSSFTIPTSTITLELPWITIPAPWPIPYAPLTVLFNPPPACASRFTYISDYSTTTASESTSTITKIGRQINLQDSTNDLTCFPQGYGQDLWAATFSPGIACPIGYTTAATGDKVGTAVWEKGVPHPEGERKVACCPSGFTYDSTTTDASACFSKYTASTEVLLEESNTPANIYVYTKSTKVGPGTAFARIIHLRYNDEELKQYSDVATQTGNGTVTGTGGPKETGGDDGGSGSASRRYGGGRISAGWLAGVVAGVVAVGVQWVVPMGGW